MKFAICNEIFQGWKPESIFRYARALGYHGVEIAPFTFADSVLDISPADRAALRDLAHRCEIEVAGIHWVLMKPGGLHVSHPDRRIRETTADYLRALVDFCADIGGKVMVVGSPKQRGILPGVSPEQATEWAHATFRPAVERAENRGVTVCLEPLGPAETNFINTAAEAIQFTGRMNSARFKIILDVKAMCSETTPIPEIIRASWPHFSHFHANDKNLKGPGFGEVNFRPIADALISVGYDGFVSVEVFDFSEGPETIASQSLACLQQAFTRAP